MSDKSSTEAYRNLDAYVANHPRGTGWIGADPAVVRRVLDEYAVLEVTIEILERKISGAWAALHNIAVFAEDTRPNDDHMANWALVAEQVRAGMKKLRDSPANERLTD